MFKLKKYNLNLIFLKFLKKFLTLSLILIIFSNKTKELLKLL